MKLIQKVLIKLLRNVKLNRIVTGSNCFNIPVDILAALNAIDIINKYN
jgi:hypothetical protein